MGLVGGLGWGVGVAGGGGVVGRILRSFLVFRVSLGQAKQFLDF